MSLELGPAAVGWIVQTAAIALVGFLLKRAIGDLDDSIRSIKIDLKALDNTDRSQAQAILELQIQSKYLNEELRQSKDALARLKERHEDFGRFLARMGFARSGNKMPDKLEGEP